MPRKPTPATVRSPDSHRRPLSRVLILLTAAHFVLLAVIAGGNLVGPENWWFGSLNLYLPQWLWALPALVLLPWYALKAVRLVWIPALLTLWAIGPIMGLCWRWTTPAATGPGVRLRVMTYNIKNGKINPQEAENEFLRWKPDLVLMQDATDTFSRVSKDAFAGWTVWEGDQYILASRYPLRDIKILPLSPAPHTRCCVRAVLTLDGTDVTLYDVHLLSPRDGLRAVRHVRSQGVERLEENVDVRLQQAAQATEYVKNEHGPLILTGDLNAPLPSVVCQELMGAGLRDAWAEAGRGYGYSYGQSTPVGFPYVRIDHIMVSAGWQVRNCKVGGSKGSEHSPVIADLFLPADAK